MPIRLAGGIKIQIPTSREGWICKFKGHDWSNWCEIDSTRMTRKCKRCGAEEFDVPPEHKH